MIQDAVIDAMAKKEVKRTGQPIEAKATVVAKTVAFPPPPVPIWVLTVKELETYFSVLETKLAMEEGKKLKRKWPKIRDGKETELPTKLDFEDQVAERILPSSLFVPGQKFPPGNLHWRLKLMCAYVFMKFDKNPDTFAEEVPDNFENKAFTLEDLKRFSKSIENSANEHNSFKKKGDRMVNIDNVPFLKDDNLNYDAVSEASDDEESVDVTHSDQVEASVAAYRPRLPPGPPGPSGLSQCSRTRPLSPRPSKSSTQSSQVVRTELLSVSSRLPHDVIIDQDDLFLDASFETGTPDESVDPDDVPLCSTSLRRNAS